MKLPRFSLPFFKKKPSTDTGENFACHFALRISTSQLQAVIWQEQPGGKPEIISRSRYIPWDTGDVENLATQADLALGECVASLPDHLEEPNDVLFGLPADWVEEGQLLPDYRQVLKDVTRILDLRAMGFVVTMEALVNYLNSLGTGAVSAILIGVDDRLLEIGLSIQGQIQQVITTPQSSDLLAGVMMSLGKLDASHLPPKIILFDGDMDLTRLQQGLIHQDWESKSLGFLHLPEVTYVPEHLPCELIVYSSISQVQTANIATQTTTGSNADTLPAPYVSENEVIDSEAEHTTQTANDIESLGFVKGKDIKEVEAPAWEGIGAAASASEGAAMVAPVTSTAPATMTGSPQPHIRDSFSHPQSASPQPPLLVNKAPQSQPDKEIPDDKPAEQKKLPIKIKKMKNVRVPWKILLIVVVCFAGVAGGLAWVYRKTTVELTLFVEPQLLEKQFPVKVDPAVDQSDPESGIIKGKVLTTEATGTQTVSTTGKTTVGDKATGEITIFNDTDTTRTLETGTTITARDSQLVFTISEEVKIASKSVDLSSDSPFKPGQAKAKVTASKIGPEYNLDGQTAFNVANFSASVLVARNDQAFTGGTSREIQAVAKADMDTATEQLLSSLESKAKEQLQQQLGDKEQLVDSSVTQEWTAREFSHEAGEETNQLTLDGTLTIEAVAYSDEDFHALANSRLSAELPDDKSMAEHTSTNFTLLDELEDGSYSFNVVTKTYLLPKLDTESVASKLAGRSISNADQYLHSLPLVKEKELVMKPNLPLPSFFQRYPFKKENITVKLVPKSG